MTARLLSFAALLGIATWARHQTVVEPADPAPTLLLSIPSAIPEVPGWLGLRTHGGGELREGEPYWTGIEGTSRVVVLNGPTMQSLPWSEVPTGTSMRMVTRAGTIPIQFLGLQVGNYCDNEVDVAAFTGRTADDLIWILPDYGASATALPLTVHDTAGERIWTFGGEQLGLTRRGTYTATVWAGARRTHIDEVDLAADRMDGSELNPMDLHSDFRLPKLVAA